MEQQAIERRFLSPREAAAYLGVSESAVLRWVREGRITASRVGRCIRIDLRVLEKIGSKGLPHRVIGPTVAVSTKAISGK